MEYKARFLGVPELFVDGVKAPFPFLKARILALLLVEEGTMSRDRACSLLWGDKSPEAGRRNLSNALSCVRGVLPLLSDSRDVLSLAPDVRIEKDLDLLDRVGSLEWERLVPLFEPFMDLADVEEWPAFSDWLLPKREAYRALLADRLRQRLRRDLTHDMSGRMEEAVRCCEKIAELEPYDEKIHGELVRLYIRLGRKVDAVRTARSFASRVEGELGQRSELLSSDLLLKRRTIPAPLMAFKAATAENPLERSGEILKMLDFFCSAGEKGRSSCGFVWGEEGIGKGAFVQEIVSRLSANGWKCCSVRFTQEERTRPMVPFVQMFRKRDQKLFSDEKNVFFTELACARLAELVYEEAASRPGEAPRLFVLENIQWMDEASWMILEMFLWNHALPRHVLVSGYGEARSLFMARTSLENEPFAVCEIPLERFSPEQTERICRLLRPERQWSREEVREVYDKTEGNPFFIRSLLCPPQEERSEQSLVPSKNPFASRIELLDPEERAFLEALAISPGPVSMLESAEALNLPPLRISELHDRVRIHGFLREKNEENGDVSYYFTHSKIREALLERMSESLRVALHRRNVEVLRGRNPSLLYRNRPIFARLVLHSREAGLGEEELFWRLGELKLHFQAVHEVFPALSDADLARHIPKAEDYVWTRQALEETRQLIDRIVRRSGRSPATLRAERDWSILKGGYLWWNGDYEGAWQILEEGLRMALRTEEDEAVAAAYGQLCYLAIQTDDGARLLPWARNLYRLALNRHLELWAGASLRFIAIGNILQGERTHVERLLQMSMRVFEKLEETGPSYTVSLIAAEHFRGDLQLAQGDAAAALRHYECCVDMGEGLGLYPGLGLSFSKAAYCALLQDNLVGARAFLERMFKLEDLLYAERRNALQGGGFAFSLMALLDALRGDWEAGGRRFELAEGLVEEQRRPLWAGILDWAKSELLRRVPDVPEGFRRRYLGEGRRRYERRWAELRSRIGWHNS